MNVEAILRMKGRDVVTIDVNMPLEDVAKLLKAKRIGAAVVVNFADRVCGLASERDLVNAIAESGSDALSRPVQEVMTKDVTSCVLSDTIDELMNLMTDRRIRHLPVIERNELVGIVSIGDVVKWRIAETVYEAEALKAYISTG